MQTGGETPTGISFFELVYDMIDFGPEVEQSILSQPSIMIKSNGYANSSVTAGIGTNGTVNLIVLILQLMVIIHLMLVVLHSPRWSNKFCE